LPGELSRPMGARERDHNSGGQGPLRTSPGNRRSGQSSSHIERRDTDQQRSSIGDQKEEGLNDKPSREIAEFAIYELKNQVEEISAMFVKDQENVKTTICDAARTILDSKLRDGGFDGR
jgi:hypothetical protein